MQIFLTIINLALLLYSICSCTCQFLT